MEFLIIGIVVAANIVFIFFKFDKGRTTDAFLDIVLLSAVTFVFSGSYGALVVGTIASLLISIYLYARPQTLPKTALTDQPLDLDSFISEFKSRSARRY